MALRQQHLSRTATLAATTLGAFATTPAPAAAQSVEWKSPATGLWSEASRWSTNVVPNGANFDVSIAAAGASPYQVGVDGDYVVNGLTLDSPLATVNPASGTTLTAAALDLRSGTFVVRGLRGARVSVAPGATFNLNNNPVLTGVTLAIAVTASGLVHASLFDSLTIEAGKALHLSATSEGTPIVLRFYGPA